jgi:hypothetical protein
VAKGSDLAAGDDGDCAGGSTLTTKICVVQGFDGTLTVLDVNSTDGNGAKFPLRPYPDET